MTRLPALTPQPSAQPSRDVSAAQRAFFQAALGKVAETPPAAPAVAPAPAPIAAAPAQPPEDRTLRPGSLIDIRI